MVVFRALTNVKYEEGKYKVLLVSKRFHQKTKEGIEKKEGTHKKEKDEIS